VNALTLLLADGTGWVDIGALRVKLEMRFSLKNRWDFQGGRQDGPDHLSI
jgi:hypothetical protein